jgi:hypothetical protein
MASIIRPQQLRQSPDVKISQWLLVDIDDHSSIDEFSERSTHNIQILPS